LTQSANAPAQEVDANLFHQQRWDQLYQNTQLEVTPNLLYTLYAKCQKDQRKYNGAKAAEVNFIIMFTQSFYMGRS